MKRFRSLTNFLPPALALTCVLLLSACQPAPIPAPEKDQSGDPFPDWPGEAFADAAADRLWTLDPVGSSIDIVVRREGPLARFGHDHVISTRAAEGYLLAAESGIPSRARLRISVERLEVDTPAAREQYRLDTEPGEADIAATRENLFSQVLEPRRWPYIHVDLSEFSLQGQSGSAALEIHVRDGVYRRRAQFRLSRGPDSLEIRGELVLRQSDLGLEPFSVLGGGLRVADAMEIHFGLVGSGR